MLNIECIALAYARAFASYRLRDLNRKRDEAQDKDQQRQQSNQLSLSIKRRLVYRFRMADARHYSQKYGDQESAGAVVINEPDDRDRRHDDKRDPSGEEMNALAEDGIDRMTAVELAGGNQIQ